MSKTQRAVVTGIGVVCPVGHSLQDFRSALVEGKLEILAERRR